MTTTTLAAPLNIYKIPSRDRSLLVVFVVSFFWSCSSLMVFSVLPTFMTEELGVSHSKLGLIEGVAISLAFLAKVFSGVLSDIYGSRKSSLWWGSLLTTISKPLFALSSSAMHIFWIRSLDRIGKGIRSSPSDALIADLSVESSYAETYGRRQTFYTLGAICGSLLALCVLELASNHYRLLFHLAIIPSLLALLLIQRGLKHRYTHTNAESSTKAPPLSLAVIYREARLLPPSFWYFMGIVSFLMLARFSEAFLTLRARQLGISIAQLPLIIIAMDVVHALVATPFGRWADKQRRQQVLLAGLVLQFFSSVLLSCTNDLYSIFMATVLVGFYMGITQGVLRALVAAASPAHLRGTAFAIFYFCSGIAVLLGNSFCGIASDCWGLPTVFFGGAVFTAIAILLFLFKK